MTKPKMDNATANLASDTISIPHYILHISLPSFIIKAPMIKKIIAPSVRKIANGKNIPLEIGPRETEKPQRTKSNAHALSPTKTKPAQ
jgi:hypothetical protein